MDLAKSVGLSRREFLHRSALASGYGLASSLGLGQQSGVTIIADAADPVASAPAAVWAAGELERSLSQRGLAVRRASSIEASNCGDVCILASGGSSATAQKLLQAANLSLPAGPEALALVRGRLVGNPLLLVCGSDVRGLVYALLEVADQVDCYSLSTDALNPGKDVVERPANAIRAITRSFQSDLEDKPWFNDREFWHRYLTMLAAQRFNRLSLSFGLAYDFTRHITDCYFHFAYPFLVSVPGYNVRAVGLPDMERDQNLEMLRFISEQAVARSLDFQLGLWTHAYEWVDSPQANYTISGLTSENHAAYCRDALQAVLKACPAISSVAFRVHGESGVAEGSYEFWKTVFDGVVNSGRKIEINMHAKGIDEKLINTALATGMPVTISPKYWAEHMGLPYQQASIRELEKPRAQKKNEFFALSSGSRSFMRYGYGDLLTADRRYGVYSRVWPGTQRLLLWGDPLFAAVTARVSNFCGEQGVDLLEPLSFKGRRGSGLPGGRCAYADLTLRPHYDWQKFLYTYRVWGRCLYNPDADPDVWGRFLRKQFGPAAPTIEAALAHASRILPLATTAHGPSAANNSYWPEMYTNMVIVEAGEGSIYGDTPSPKVFGNASSFDPELFGSANDCAREMLQKQRSGRISPIDVAQWLEDMAYSAAKYLTEAEQRVTEPQSPEFRRTAIDVAIQTGLGQFFAGKFRAAVLYAIFQQSGDPTALEQAIVVYRRARNAWANLAQRARDVYAADVTYGPEKHLRGHWLDRLAAIDQDIAAMERQKEGSAAAGPERELAQQGVHEALGRPARPA
ncbi:MAG TPA: hypothetical protein VNB49_19495, partial [Candidatus Dormibacteraeota bacterium]|nr:hypothetical protein [Candidatus Dormibacteraeota bacterium]